MRFHLRTALLCVALAACRSTDRPVAPGQPGGAVIIDIPDDAGMLFPPLVVDATGRLVENLVFDHLAEISQAMNTTGDRGFAPRLAKSWQWAPDSLSIAFAIDPRARWHDGRAVTASDVRFTYRIYVDTAVGSPTATVITNIDSVSVRDSLTAVVWFKRRTPEQFYDVAYQLSILPEHVYGAIPPGQLRKSDLAQHPVGSGRFRFARHDPGSRIDFVSDTANYRGRALLDRVILMVTRDVAVAGAQVLGAQADYFEAFPIDQASRLDSNAVARGIAFGQAAYTFLGMNPRDPKAMGRPHPIFGDRAVRRALSMAVDRRAMLTNVFGSYGRLGYGPFPRVVATADTTLRVPPYDTAAASALLDSAGWHAPTPGAVRVKGGRPLRFTIIAPTSSLFRTRYAVLIQDALRRVGAQVDIDRLDFRAFLDKQNAGDFDATMGSYNVDPSVSGTKQNWGSGTGVLNALGYSNSLVDALLDSAATSFDAAKTRSYAARAYQTIADDVPAIWLYDVVTVAAAHRRINLAPMRPDGWWSNLADWSIDPAARLDRDKVGLTLATP
jgi:peptide/nickel transport system substrate-binding protein